jgi:hypothetical protein
MTQVAPLNDVCGLRITSGLFRSGRRRVAFRASAPVAPATTRRPAGISRMVALAHHVQVAIDRGLVRDRSTVARQFDITTARVTQILDLLLLAPDIQEHLLKLEAIDGVEPVSEKRLRRLCLNRNWREQRLLWKRVQKHLSARVPVRGQLRTGYPSVRT